jgi:hypothetical protein
MTLVVSHGGSSGWCCDILEKCEGNNRHITVEEHCSTLHIIQMEVGKWSQKVKSGMVKLVKLL